jgi:hypothetical protein
MGIARKLSQALSTLKQDGWLVGFRQEDCQEYERKARYPDQFIDRPSPAVRLSREASYYGSNNRPIISFSIKRLTKFKLTTYPATAPNAHMPMTKAIWCKGQTSPIEAP